MDIQTSDYRPLKATTFIQLWGLLVFPVWVGPPPAVALTNKQGPIGSYMEDVERYPWADKNRLVVAETTKPQHRTSYLHTAKTRQLHNAARGQPRDCTIVVVSKMRLSSRKSSEDRKPRRQPEDWNCLGLRPVCRQRHQNHYRQAPERPCLKQAGSYPQSTAAGIPSGSCRIILAGVCAHRVHHTVPKIRTRSLVRQQS